MQRCVLLLILAVGLAMGLAGPARAAQPAAGTDNTSKAPIALGMIQHLRDAVAELNLPDDQAAGINQLIDKARDQIVQLADKTAPSERAQAFAPVFRGLEQQLTQKLSSDQMKQVAQNMRLAGEAGLTPNGADLYALLKETLPKLDLSADQKQKINDLFSDADKRIGELKQSALDGDDVTLELAQFRRDLRTNLMNILTQDQQQTLTRLVRQQMAQQKPSAPLAPTTRPAGAGNGAGAANGAVPIPVPLGPASDFLVNGPQVGATAPPIHLNEVNGATFDLAKQNGRVVVIEFGSLSCPVFRDNAAAMDELRQESGERAYFVIVYTHEAFPAGDQDVTRNQTEGISVPEPQTFLARESVAKRVRDLLKIQTPIAIDSMDNAVAKEYGAFPNGVIVIDKYGKIAGRQQWANPDSLPDLIESATLGK